MGTNQKANLVNFITLPLEAMMYFYFLEMICVAPISPAERASVGSHGCVNYVGLFLQGKKTTHMFVYFIILNQTNILIPTRGHQIMVFILLLTSFYNREAIFCMLSATKNQ